MDDRCGPCDVQSRGGGGEIQPLEGVDPGRGPAIEQRELVLVEGDAKAGADTESGEGSEEMFDGADAKSMTGERGGATGGNDLEVMEGHIEEAPLKGEGSGARQELDAHGVSRVEPEPAEHYWFMDSRNS